MKRLAFTLIELLTVIAIVAIVAALIIPVLGSAKRRSLQSVSISNLRQCYIALTEYNPDGPNFDTLPNQAVADNYIKGDIKFDPGDYWRRPGQLTLYKSLVGSYGYVNAPICTNVDLTPSTCGEDVLGKNFPVLVSVFYSTSHCKAAEYIVPDATNTCPMPDRPLALWIDGHIKVEHPQSKPSEYFLWGALFFAVTRNHAQIGS